jgi:ABC-type antimicrobial peptide transport system permease subunit
MFKVNIKFALRHLIKNKSYTVLNILGLTFGMSCALIIFLWIYNEYRYDKFHEKVDNLYQVVRYEKYADGNSDISPTLSAPLAPALLSEIPEIKAVTRIPWSPKALFKYKDKAFFEQGILVDSSFFEMFSFKLKKGDPKHILLDPGNIVISEKLAEKYFGQDDPIGKTVTISENETYIIAGILENVKPNSTLQFDYVTSFEVRLKQQPWLKDSWGNLVLNIYIETKPNTSQAIINQKIKDIYQKNHSYGNAELFTHPFSRIHLYPYEHKDKKTDGLINLLVLLSITAGIILAIACINFANLSTAMSSKRSREIGIKKVLGSAKVRLIGQFLAESMIISAFGMLLTITCTELLLPYFNLQFSKSLDLNYSDPVIPGTIFTLWLITAVLSGIYPALVISSFKPVDVLKSNTSRGIKGAGLKKVLVVFQFTMAIVLIVLTLVVSKQTQYVKNKNLGIEKENIFSFTFYNGISKHQNTFKQELEAIPGVKQMTYCSMNPLNVGQATKDPQWEGKKPEDDKWFSIITTDFDFLKTFDVKLKDGRDFSANFTTDSSNFIINEETAKAMGFNTAADQKLSMWGKTGKVIGIAKNFHIGHLAMPILPLIININPSNTNIAFVKIEGANKPAILKKIENVYKKYETDYPFEFMFQTDFFNQTYKNNLFMIGTISFIFSILAIVISCLGLYGLTSYAAEQRTKEIGVRKVNGATLSNILRLLITDFLKWVALAYVFGTTISLLLTYRFLKIFAFHFEINAWIFVYAGLAAFGIALLTVIWQAFRAASKNPVESLRYE